MPVSRDSKTVNVEHRSKKYIKVCRNALTFNRQLASNEMLLDNFFSRCSLFIRLICYKNYPLILTSLHVQL